MRDELKDLAADLWAQAVKESGIHIPSIRIAAVVLEAHYELEALGLTRDQARGMVGGAFVGAIAQIAEWDGREKD